MTPDRPRASEVARRAVDLVVATTLLTILAIPMLVIWVVIRLDSAGPAIFKQTRVGRGRRPFTLVKFRSMRVDADDADHRRLVEEQLAAAVESTGVQKLVDDPRVTRVGRFLRRWSLDELPQLVNVAAGQMTLVGPRPCLPWEADLFSPEQARRFEVKPGLTGLWQVSGRGSMGMAEALELDVEYVERRSLLLDVRLLLRTPAALLRSRRETA